MPGTKGKSGGARKNTGPRALKHARLAVKQPAHLNGVAGKIQAITRQNDGVLVEIRLADDSLAKLFLPKLKSPKFKGKPS